MLIKPYPALGACLLFSLLSCIKPAGGDEPANVCESLSQLHTHTFTPVEKGGSIRLEVDSLDVAQYQWRGPGGYQSYSQNPLVTNDAHYSDRGWYYVSFWTSDCDSYRDSVYVDVKFPQGSPTCSLTNNTATFNNLPTQSFSYIDFNSGSGNYQITANSSNGDVRMFFSSYWLTHPFEDGIYYSTSDPLPGGADIDQVHIEDVNSNIRWSCGNGTPIYISHVNGKARISFCGLNMSGSLGGPSYQTSVNLQLTQP